MVQLTDSTGKVVKNYEYDPFGNEKNIDPNDGNAFRYCGEYFDRESGNYYLRARYYDPDLGRFTQEDDYAGDEDDPLSLNYYLYCDGDPINRVDPDGDDSYILYDPHIFGKNTGYKYASVDQKALEEKYGTPVHLKECSTPRDFFGKLESHGG